MGFSFWWHSSSATGNRGKRRFTKTKAIKLRPPHLTHVGYFCKPLDETLVGDTLMPLLTLSLLVGVTMLTATGRTLQRDSPIFERNYSRLFPAHIACPTVLVELRLWLNYHLTPVFLAYCLLPAWSVLTACSCLSWACTSVSACLFAWLPDYLTTTTILLGYRTT
jgi:hypothetical protein